MPHTLAHLGIQGFVGSAAQRTADPKWIALGCLLPDLPWILQRAMRFALGRLGLLDSAAPLDVLYDVRLYFVVQASLLWCWLLAAATACVARRPLRVWGVLGLGALVHLLLDGTETRWGNGVHLLAPFDWHERNAEWYWPESPVPLVLGVLGMVWVVFTWRRAIGSPPELELRPRRLALAGLFGALYLISPLAFLDQVEASGSHSIGVLHAESAEDREARVGRAVELHRVYYDHRPDGVPVVRTASEEQLEVPGLELPDHVRVSVRGNFATPERIAVREWHVHAAGTRDALTVAGLLAVVAPWATSFAGVARDRKGERKGRNCLPRHGETGRTAPSEPRRSR